MCTGIWNPAGLIKRNKIIDINSSQKETEVDVNKKIIGEIKPEYAHWYIYHPTQLRITLDNIAKEKSENAQLEENKTLGEYTNSIEDVTGGSREENYKTWKRLYYD